VSVARDPRRSGFVGGSGSGRTQFKLGNNGGDALGRQQYPPTHAINRAESTRAALKSQTDRQSLNELSARVYRVFLLSTPIYILTQRDEFREWCISGQYTI